MEGPKMQALLEARPKALGAVGNDLDSKGKVFFFLIWVQLERLGMVS